MGFIDGAIDARCEPEIVGVDDEASHGFSVASEVEGSVVPQKGAGDDVQGSPRIRAPTRSGGDCLRRTDFARTAKATPATRRSLHSD
jgi:hypothetical protein